MPTPGFRRATTRLCRRVPRIGGGNGIAFAGEYLYFATTGPAVHAAQLDELEAEGEVHENHFVARVPAESKAAIGQSIELAFDTTKLAVFDADSGVNLTISAPATE